MQGFQCSNDLIARLRTDGSVRNDRLLEDRNPF
jgi:hypothetical protein